MARGYVRKRGKKWCAEIHLGVDENGKQKRMYITRDTKKAAEAEAAKVLNEINSGAFVEPTKMTVKELLERWLKEWVAPNRRPNTVKAYEDAMTHILPELGHIHIQKLSSMEIQSYYRRKLEFGRKDGNGGLSTTTVHSHHRCLHAALEVAVKWGLVARNVADAVQPPQPNRKRAKTWTQEQMAKFLDYVSDHRLYAMFVLEAATGLRRGELCALRRKDIDLKNLTIHVRQTIVSIHGQQMIQPFPKTDSSEASLSISPDVAEVLRHHLKEQLIERLAHGPEYEDSELVFCQPNGKWLWIDNFSTRDFYRLCRLAGVPRIRFHDMRHTYATHLLNKGIPIPVVQRRMRHSRPSTTLDMYGHCLPESERKAALETDDLIPKRRKKAN